jgi:hypothetical protein
MEIEARNAEGYYLNVWNKIKNKIWENLLKQSLSVTSHCGWLIN